MAFEQVSLIQVSLMAAFHNHIHLQEFITIKESHINNHHQSNSLAVISI